MSKLATRRGDDHPEAAQKHLRDASALLAANRPDGAAYLCGYVIECSLKSLIQLETGAAHFGHSVSDLAGHATSLALVASSKAARYLGATTAGIVASPINAWKPQLRYRAPSMSTADAQSWHTIAHAVFSETVAQMKLDGEL
jgi:hypothetical protein